MTDREMMIGGRMMISGSIASGGGTEADGGMTADGSMWLDEAAGPVVRPYALIRGRTLVSGAPLGLLDIVFAARLSPGDTRGMAPEHKRLLSLCRDPVAVADLAAEIDLPLGVVRVLVGDLRECGLVTVAEAQGRAIPAESVLRNVLDGLRTL
jgi:Protein of unknown function (DUF742)